MPNPFSYQETVLFQTIQFSISTVKLLKTFLFQTIQFSQTVLIQTIQFSIIIVFVYTQMSTVLFQTILFCVSSFNGKNSSISNNLV